MLDAALGSPLMEVAKFTTVPFLVGVPLALSWPLLPLVTRGLMGEPDFPCRSPWLALYRRAQSALHPLPLRSASDRWGCPVDCSNGVAGRVGLVCDRRQTDETLVV